MRLVLLLHRGRRRRRRDRRTATVDDAFSFDSDRRHALNSLLLVLQNEFDSDLIDCALG